MIPMQAFHISCPPCPDCCLLHAVGHTCMLLAPSAAGKAVALNPRSTQDDGMGQPAGGGELTSAGVRVGLGSKCSLQPY